MSHGLRHYSLFFAKHESIAGPLLLFIGSNTAAVEVKTHKQYESLTHIQYKDGRRVAVKT